MFKRVCFVIGRSTTQYLTCVSNHLKSILPCWNVKIFVRLHKTLNSLLVFDNIFEIWLLNFNSLSNFIPSHIFTYLGDVHYYDQIKVNDIYQCLILYNCLQTNGWLIQFPSSFSNNFARFSWQTKGVVLLAKLQISILFKSKNKSFKHILKRTGPNIALVARGVLRPAVVGHLANLVP